MKIRLAFIFVLISSVLSAQLITPFTIRYQVTQKGGIRYVSNTSVTCSGGGCGAGRTEIPPAGTSTDNGFTAAYVDIDADATTFSSSSDSLNLPSCSQISWAGLYWGGEITSAAPNFATRGQCKIKVNNGSYVNLTATSLQDNAIGFDTYHCFVDITSIVSAAGTNSRFTVANVAARVGGTNRFGGWSIVVVYKNDLQPMRNLTVFNGLSNVSGSNPTTDITVSGFLTPLAGPVTFEVGNLTFDGDRSSTGDQLMFNGGSGFVNISDAVNPLNDIFNSTLSYNGVQKTAPFINPAYTNSLGWDADIFIPNNAAKNYIGNSATTATLRLTTGGETFLTQVVTMAIDVYEPDLRAAVRARDINGGLVVPGDTLEYTIVGKNIGSDPSVNTYILDTLERNAIYVPGSLKVTYGPNSGNKTDVSSDDQGEYISASRTIRVRIGTGANAVTGGTVLNSSNGADSTQIKFRCTASSDCILLLCDNIINARAYIYGTGNVSGNTWSNGSNPDIFDAFGCPIPGTTTTPIQSAICPAIAASSNTPVCVGGTINLSLNSTSTNATYLWTGPNGFSSTVAAPSIPSATLAMAGTYTCVVTITGYTCTTTVNTVVVVNPAPTSANAGPDQSICAATGSVVMAGNLPASGTGIWTQVSGPSASTITSPTSNTSSVTGLTSAGTYLFQWTISTSCAASSDQIQVVVSATPTVSNAGPDASVCGLTAALAGNVPTTGTGTWTLVSGPGTATFVNANLATTSVTVSVVGAYTFRWTIANSPCTASQDNVIITFVASTTTANAGPDQTICSTVGSVTMAGNIPAVGTGTWTQVSGPVTGTITTPGSATTTITGLTTAGTYVFQWSIANAPCTASTDQISVNVNPAPTVSNAGPDASVCGLVATLVGNTPTAGIGTWTQTAGPGTTTFSNANSTNSNATASVVGVYTYTWTIANAPCTASQDNVVITFVASPTTANAGPDQTICSTGGSVTMAGNTPTVGTGTWTQVSGPVTGIITTPGSATTTITGLTTAGTYVFQWSIANAPCAASTDQISVVVSAPPTASNAGPDASVCGLTATLAGNVPTTGTGTWTLVAGPGTATFVNANLATTNVTVSVVGAYTFRWTIANSPCTASQDNVIITFAASPTTANAGPDQTICTTTGTATMAGNNPIAGAGTWTLVSGPSTPTITAPGNRNTTVTGLTTAGTYVFQWTIANAPCASSTDQVAIIVNAPPTTSNAGPDQTICSTSVTMAGNTPATGAGTWTQVSGPNTATITTPGSASSTMTGLISGTYVFQWTIANAPCAASSDQVSIIVSAPPTTSNAGPDQTICSTTGSVTMAGNTAVIGIGTWTQVSGPAAGTITTPGSATTTITGLTTAGTYVFQWTITNVCGSSSDQISVIVNAPPTASNAGPDASVCGLLATLAGNTPNTGTGTWTQTAGPGTTTFSNANSASSTATASVVGIYTYTWTIANAPCTATTDNVVITFVASPTTSNAGPDQTICTTTGSATMAGNTPLVGTGAWTQVSGPVTGTITTPGSSTTTITGLTTAGTYVFQWSIANAPCAASTDQITVIVNDPPTASAAGSDASGCGLIATLAGNTPTIGTGTWAQTSGPGTTTFFNANSASSAATVSVVGVYTYTWTITNAPCAASTDNVVVTFVESPSTSNAGPDQTICTTTGSAIMAGNTPAIGAGTWTQVSGPTTGTITSPGSATTTITGLTTAGTYVFEWTIANAPCAASTDQITVIVNDPPTVSAAGSDASVCGLLATLTANTPTVGTGVWTQTSGPGTSTFTNANAGNSDVTVSFSGVYTFTWTISNAPCASSQDDVVLTFVDAPTVALAGADDTVCGLVGVLAGNTATTGIGTWTVVSGPGTVTFANANLETTSFTVSIGGTYTLVWTMANAPCTASTDTIQFTLDAIPTTASAGPDQNGVCPPSITMAANAPVFGTGLWSQLSGPNTANILTSNSDTSTVGGLIPGTYLFIWTISNGSCPSTTDTVSVTVIGCDNDGDGILDATDIDDDNDGIPDTLEASGDTDGDGVPDSLDLDSDNDGIPDVVEAGGTDADGDGIVDGFTDANGDGLDDNTAANPLPLPDTDGDGLIDVVDLDSDNDGITDVVEVGGTDANGDGIIDGYVDTDGDGFTDTVDSTTGGTALPTPDTDGDGNVDYLDIDADNDGIVDNVEAQTTVGYVPPTGNDTDGDGIDDAYDADNGGTPIVLANTDGADNPDYLDLDSDNDGMTDLLEGWDTDNDGVANTTPSGNDSDGDGLDDAFDVDGTNTTNAGGSTNGGTVPTGFPDLDNAGGDRDWRDPIDHDGDGIPDNTDIDDDNDGILDTLETNADTDGDGIPNSLDLDSDNDGIPDIIEVGGPDANGDGIVDNFIDTNGDGLDDNIAANPLPNLDTDGDGIPNTLDLDSDNDGILDVTEAGGTDANGDGLIDGYTDTNGNGLSDNVDPNAGGTSLPNADTDSDGHVNFLDIDADNDGIVDNVEGQSTGGYAPPTGNDTDGDGIDDAYDIDNGGSPIIPVNTDGVDQPDYLDLDSDNDGDPDALEAWDTNNDGDPEVTPSGNDSDGDGLDDAYDIDGTSTTNNGGPTNGGSTPGSFPDLDNPGADRDWRELKGGTLFVPSGFSPNGDGVNDFFEIVGIEGYPDNKVTIFNRWGNLVFEGIGYNNTTVRWDGENTGVLSPGDGPVPEGTYFYVIDLGDGSDLLSGYVFLNRK